MCVCVAAHLDAHSCSDTHHMSPSHEHTQIWGLILIQCSNNSSALKWNTRPRSNYVLGQETPVPTMRHNEKASCCLQAEHVTQIPPLSLCSQAAEKKVLQGISVKTRCTRREPWLRPLNSIDHTRHVITLDGVSALEPLINSCGCRAVCQEIH